MHAEDEARAFAAVIHHLEQRFPGVPADHISTVLQVEKARFTRARIRDFVPLLAERAAAVHLGDEARSRTASV